MRPFYCFSMINFEKENDKEFFTLNRREGLISQKIKRREKNAIPLTTNRITKAWMRLKLILMKKSLSIK
jgi:hypothetical protein